MISPRSRSAQLLVAWYGLFQAAHLVVNFRGLIYLWRGEAPGFPAPAPPQGWSEQALHFLLGLALVDILGALLALLFALAYVQHRPSWPPLGLLALTLSTYGTLVFNYGTLASGAWAAENRWMYLLINVAFAPVLVLFALFCVWHLRGELPGRAAPEH